jgi:hypothetical protein
MDTAADDGSESELLTEEQLKSKSRGIKDLVPSGRVNVPSEDEIK